MGTGRSDLVVLRGRVPILMVAPHGVNQYPMDDIGTDRLAETMARRAECWAVINRTYRKPRRGECPDIEKERLDLNRKDQAAMHPTYLQTLLDIVEAAPHMLVVWLHGIKDRHLENEISLLDASAGQGQHVHGLIGYGQGGRPADKWTPSAYTATHRTIRRFSRCLASQGLNLRIADAMGSHYRGRHEGYMNQWLRLQGYPLSRVESVQLELGFKGLREETAIEGTAEALARSLLSFGSGRRRWPRVPG